MLESNQKVTKKDTIDPNTKKTAKKVHSAEEISTLMLTMITTHPNTN